MPSMLRVRCLPDRYIKRDSSTEIFSIPPADQATHAMWMRPLSMLISGAAAVRKCALPARVPPPIPNPWLSVASAFGIRCSQASDDMLQPAGAVEARIGRDNRGDYQGRSTRPGRLDFCRRVSPLPGGDAGSRQHGRGEIADFL